MGDVGRQCVRDGESHVLPIHDLKVDNELPDIQRPEVMLQGGPQVTKIRRTCLVHYDAAKHFMSEEDWGKLKVNEPGRHELSEIPGSKRSLQSYILTYFRL